MSRRDRVPVDARPFDDPGETAKGAGDTVSKGETMLHTVLIVLTLGQGDAIHLAVSEAETMADCEGKAEVVSQILSGAGYTIEAMRCGQTDMMFTPYTHEHHPEDYRWHYHVALKGAALTDGFTLRKTDSGACTADGAGEYCTISAQGPAQ
ncbi:hypothetical protein [Marivita sp. GX14005]|uniref:hypothetical protein n=1 Tax=Marivita sp. GX14005 TaxID=2942276 RepID=UPI002018EAF5|nr:hypothetical protein [Marivita sp. GX14005]MCL3883141.1 hypothetical protein [Marivita sp. GX14005]